MYIHTSPIGKSYCGITSKKLSERLKNSKWTGYKTCRHMMYAIQKYGPENFATDIVAMDLTREEAEAMEKQIISDFKLNDDRYGYNIEGGGSREKVVPDETKELLKKNHRYVDRWGSKNGNAKAVCQFDLDGNFVAEFETEVDAVKNKNCTRIWECCKNKHLTAGGYYWRKKKDFEDLLSMERELKALILSEIDATARGKKRAVIQCDITGNYIREYPSTKQAAREIGVNQSSISNCCAGRKKTCKGFYWQYKNVYLKNLNIQRGVKQ